MPPKLLASLAIRFIAGVRGIFDFAEAWYEAHENAVDVVENVMYQQAVGGNTLAGIFYLKAHRPIYRDRLNINVEQVQSDIDEMMDRFRANPG